MPRTLAFVSLTALLLAAGGASAQNAPAQPNCLPGQTAVNGSCVPTSATAPVQPITDPLMQSPPPPPAAQRNVVVPPTSGRPVSPAVVKPLGLIQNAWDNPYSNRGDRQTRPGFLKLQWHPDDVLTLNVREGMLTVIKFPENEEILTQTVSDTGSFETQATPNRHAVILRALYAGVDGNLVLVGSSGNVYNFYVRSMPYNAPRLPDTTVQVIVAGMKMTTGETEPSSAPISDPYDSYSKVFRSQARAEVAAFKAGDREFARVTPVSNDNMANNIVIKVRDEADRAIAPVRAWHDDHFTYLDFGPRASSMNQWPVASMIIQGVESPVGTRVTGRDRSMMIIESVGDMVLRNGTLMVCLSLVMPPQAPGDGRYSIPPRNVDPRPAALKTAAEPVVVTADDQTIPAASLPPPAHAKAPTRKPGVAIVTPPMTAAAGQTFWASLQKKYPSTGKSTPEWLDGDSPSQYAPGEGATKSIMISGLTVRAAKALCGPGQTACKIVSN